MAHTYLHSASPQATLQKPGSEPPLSSFQPSTGPPCHPPNSSSDPSFSSASAAQQQQRVATVATRSSSLPFHLQMGLSQSKPAAAASSSSPSSAPPTASAKNLAAADAGGFSLKRAFARRRKNSEDASKLFAQERQDEKLKAAVSSPSLATDRAVKSAPPMTAVQRSAPSRIDLTKPHPPPPSPLNSATSPLQQPSPPPLPPTPPKKDFPSSEVSSAGSRISVMDTTGITSAVNFITLMDKSEAEKENAKGELKENWRKSDSTNSHHTIRPVNAGTTSRSSRPVSWAESFQSAHTVIQSSNKRRSALIGDADFGMPEEDDEDVSVSSHAAKSSPNASTRSLKRRSMSLNLGSTNTPQPPPIPASDMKYPSLSISEGLPPFSATHLPRAHAISPSPSQPQPSSAPNNLRDRLTAWSAASGNQCMTVPPVTPASQERNLSPAPRHAPQPSTSPSSFRQTAISMSAGVGPAAAGIARRAVDKIGKKWAQVSASSSASASSSSINEPWSDVLVRTSSNSSATTPSLSIFHTPIRVGHKRTPTAAGSISSSSMASGSDSDFFARPPEAHLGERLRGPMRSKNGVQAIAGVVFGRDLASGVRETGIRVGKPPGAQETRRKGLLGQFDERRLAAVAVRCAQHLLLWGIQEEGLFRVTGRPAHVSRLRSEFDAGADYDMAECSPGDLDPHAVASVFKAYLRELPEPILTQKLQPLFDAAVSKETNRNAPDSTSPPRLNGRTMQGLPTGPKNGFAGNLRKPPSLSTLALPSFTGIPPASQALISTIRALIKRLPLENHDLLLTVVDLIKETARNHKETKMPLSNLLVVFCPSLNMTPPLLKTLCEVNEIWSDDALLPAKSSEAMDIPAVIDIRRQSITKDDDSSIETRSRMDEESDSIASTRPSLDNPSSDYHGSAEGSVYDGRPMPRTLRPDFDRSEVPTVYMDTRSHLSSTSSASSLLQQDTPATAYDAPFSRHMRDLASDNGSISSGGAYSMHNAPFSASSPPPLSSSAESIVTPTSSGNPSFTDLELNAAANKDQDSQHALGMQHSHHNGSGPLIVEGTPLELNVQASKRPFISKPAPISTQVQFPVDAPSTPSPTQTKRRSIPLLSLPSFTPVSPIQSAQQASPRTPHSPGPGPEPRTLRAKKPSLKLLFSKRSTSSLNSTKERIASGISFISAPIIEGAHQAKSGSGSGSDSSSSVSTPLSAVTAPQDAGSAHASCMQFPPVLDTPIEDASLSMDLGFDVSPPTTATLGERRAGSMGSRSPYNSPAIEPKKTFSAAQAANSPYGYGYGQEASKMSVRRRTIKPGEDHIRPQASSSNLSIVSTASSHHLSLFEDDEEEGMEGWTQSVLLAADVDGKWVVQKPESQS